MKIEHYKGPKLSKEEIETLEAADFDVVSKTQVGDERVWILSVDNTLLKLTFKV